jgi:2'-5' RNA ligase
MRLFYAIEIQRPLQDRIDTASLPLRALGGAGIWSRTENIHLTLQFLGECPTNWLPQLCQILRQATGSCPVFCFTVNGCGTFGRQHQIFWMGVVAGPPLYTLAGQLQAGLKAESLPHDDRPFSPHITLARQVRLDAEALRSFQYPPIDVTVRAVSLMESSRQGGQLVYRAIETAPLAPSASWGDKIPGLVR